MRPTLFVGLVRLLLALCLAAGTSAHALTPADALALVDGDTDVRIDTLNKLAAEPDEKASALIKAMASEAVRVQGERVFIVVDEAAVDAVTGEKLPLPDDASEVMINNRLRSAMESALAGMELVGAPPERQREAARTLQRSAFEEHRHQPARPDRQGPGRQNLDAQARQSLELAQAAVLLASEDPAQRLAAAKKLGEAKQPIVRPLLMQQIEKETDAGVKAALGDSLKGIDRMLALGNTLAQAFTGISLGSILLLAALGLAITYGLMGVINMAHGELIMIGAYATWLVQVFFRQSLPERV